ncbi:hypothetical protein AGR5A_Cc60095 [Agrobacterium genomosp. 5 str. CFBP 6626]|nr:hypothetical protein AGR5A_Cc60095 [Agrobacterium genomosp. 5 str. CFBP 6626]
MITINISIAIFANATFNRRRVISAIGVLTGAGHISGWSKPGTHGAIARTGRRRSIPDGAFMREREEYVHELHERRFSADEKPGRRHRDMRPDDHVRRVRSGRIRRGCTGAAERRGLGA